MRLLRSWEVRHEVQSRYGPSPSVAGVDSQQYLSLCEEEKTAGVNMAQTPGQLGTKPALFGRDLPLQTRLGSWGA